MEDFAIKIVDDNKLACPSCSEPNGLHVDASVTAAYAREDHPDGQVIVDSQGNVRRFANGLVATPANRRHAIGLAGWCELCGKNFVIWFEQHKGETFIHADLNPDPAFLDAANVRQLNY